MDSAPLKPPQRQDEIHSYVIRKKRWANTVLLDRTLLPKSLRKGSWVTGELGIQHEVASWDATKNPNKSKCT